MSERGRSAARRDVAIGLSAECLGWARAAHYVSAIADDGDVLLRSEVGAPSRYFIRRRRGERLELTEAIDGDDEHPLLFVASLDVLERHLIGFFADEIREDLDLPFLELPWSAAAFADGFELSALTKGYRTLSRVGLGPVAAAPDPILSMPALVPLSHLLGFSVSDLKRWRSQAVGASLQVAMM